jgi:hypothetical protein
MRLTENCLENYENKSKLNKLNIQKSKSQSKTKRDSNLNHYLEIYLQLLKFSIN